MYNYNIYSKFDVIHRWILSSVLEDVLIPFGDVASLYFSAWRHSVPLATQHLIVRCLALIVRSLFLYVWSQSAVVIITLWIQP